MVNLMTGDFTYNIPLLEVPGPEGGFSLPLSYHAGIGTLQDPTWVGLGWSLNPGAIVRSVNGFPDDANGEGQSVTVQDLTGLRGWNANILFVGQFGWNNNTGHYGSVSINLLNAEWKEGYTSVGIAGINMTSDGLKVDVETLVATAVGFAIGGNLSDAAKDVMTAVGRGMQAGSFVANAIRNSPSAPGGYWAYKKQETNLVFFQKYRVWLDQSRVEKMYGQLYLGNAPITNVPAPAKGAIPSMTNGGVSETLYQFENSTDFLNTGAASDINSTPDAAEAYKEYRELNNPVFLAPDQFSVQAPGGISGGIRPYRLDVGSVSMPREMTSWHQRMAPVRYLNNYKVPFVYDGQMSSAYYHHVGGASSITSPTFYYGLGYTNNTSGQGTVTYQLNDVALKTQRIRSDINSSTSKKIPQANYVEWLSNDEIKSAMTYPSGYMDYFNGGAGPGISTSSDRYLKRNALPVGYTPVYSASASLPNATSPSRTIIPIASYDINKFTIGDVVDLNLAFYSSAEDYEAGNSSGGSSIPSVTITGKSSTSIESTDSRLNSFWGQSANIEVVLHKFQQSPTSIGGFCITGADGTTYHFALPIYDYDMTTEIREKSDHSKNSVTRRVSPFANSWLLTGITGVDFVDRNNNGMIDETDWGYWVKLNYGMHRDNAPWRIPAAGWSNLEGNQKETYTGGKSQLFYLNSIETRSHVALFVKNDNENGETVFDNGSRNTLRLDDIHLITRDHYKKLIKPTGQGGYGVTDYSNQVVDVLHAGSLPSNALTFLKQNSVRRIHFTYSYDLAKLNAGDTYGKLTLTRVGVLGRNDAPVMPDYKFQYANNPAAGPNDFDGWGLYNPAGDVGYTTHGVSSDDQHGAAWSLTGITTPLGGQISVAYERDSYYSVSGMNTEEATWTYNNTNYDVEIGNRLTVPNASALFTPGDQVRLSGYTSFTCPGNQPKLTSHSAEELFTIVSVGTNYIDLDAEFDKYSAPENCGSGYPVHVDVQSGSIFKTTASRKGGNLRVGSITVSNDYGVSKKVRYLYEKVNGSGSGVVSQEPPYIASNYYFSELSGYPQTPVIYERTVVLNGKLTTDTDFTSKDVYQFETPHYSMYQLNRVLVQGRTQFNSWFYNGTLKTYRDYMTRYENKVEDRTSKIGKIKSVEHWDNQGNMVSSSVTTYTDQIFNENNNNNFQGIYTDGAIMIDRIPHGEDIDHKMSRTTVIRYPYAVKNVVNTKDGFTSETSYQNWDFLTGSALERIDKSPQGIYIKTVTKPAYKVYSEMGDKTSDVTRKNMLMVPAANYVYRVDKHGNTLGLMGASATTWKKNWTNYRVYNSGPQTFSDADDTDGKNVWRMSGNYFYKGTYSSLRSDGTLAFTSANDFNFADPGASTGWQYVGENTRYDHFSTSLESKDKDNIYAAAKFGYNERFKIAEAGNAMYTEVAFSSAEDLRPDIPFFGGEVAKGSGAVVRVSLGEATEVHTGDAALSLTSGYGFVYKPSSLTPNRTYRISAWTNSTNGRVYYKLNGGAEIPSPAPTVATKAGNWYRINFEVPVASFTSLEVGVTNASPAAAILFDDFRFQPADAVMTTYVITPPDQVFTLNQSNFEYVLDNENLFTKYEFSKRGLLIKTYQETFGFGPKLVSENRDNYKRFYVNQ